MRDILPWLERDWQRITASADSLHHGVLLGGINGIGKREFAVALAQRLLCGKPEDNKPCGVCQDCSLFASGTHPDFHVLCSENETVNGRIELLGLYSERYQDGAARDKKANPAQVIPVDQVRQLIGRFYQSSHISNRRVALLVPADRLNVNAANALLKLLEEPPAGAHFVLVTDHPGLLPSTIRSRCIVETLTAPSKVESEAWLAVQGVESADQLSSLQLSMGPFTLLQSMESGALEQDEKNLKSLIGLVAGRKDPVELAMAMSKQDIPSLLQWMQHFTVALIKWQSAELAPQWAQSTGLDITRISSQKLHGVYDKIAKYRSLAREQINPQLALEELTIAMQRALRSN